MLRKFKDILYIKATPHNLALSFGIGVFIGISPFIGLHTLIGVAVCFLYRFNKFALFAGVYVTNPWTLVPVYTFSTWLGAVMVGADLSAIVIDWSDMSFGVLMDDLKPVVLPFFVGSTVCSIIAGISSYFLIRPAVIRAHARRDAALSSVDMPGVEGVSSDSAPVIEGNPLDRENK